MTRQHDHHEEHGQEQKVEATVSVASGNTPLRCAYADPPYPGRAHLYENHPDYAGEVDHNELLSSLCLYDGWALSTSAEALPDVLELVRRWEDRPTRILAWVKHTVTVSWEPVIVCSARRPEGVRDWIQVEPDSYQWREKPDSYVIGQKPEAFCLWMLAWLGAAPTDSFDDLFPGSGNVGRAWDRWRAQPELPIARSASAEKRAGRRALVKALSSSPALDTAAPPGAAPSSLSSGEVSRCERRLA